MDDLVFWKRLRIARGCGLRRIACWERNRVYIVLSIRNRALGRKAHFRAVPLLAAPALALCIDHAVACATATSVVFHVKNCLKNTDGAAGGDRTHDPWLRRPILYPLSYSRTYLWIVVWLALRQGFARAARL